MAFKVILLAVVVSLYLTEAAVKRDEMLGGADYLPCESCNVPESDYPKEGRMACYQIRRTNKTVLGRVERCKTTECSDFDPFCLPVTTCSYPLRNVTIIDCKLEHRFDKEINQQNESCGTIYQVNSPHFFENHTYPENTYCIWNIANEGLVTYRIIQQQLQNAGDCDGPRCDCPDSMIVRMGHNEIKLCGSTMPPMVNHMSLDGLQVKFCSDNKHEAKGILLMAYRHNNQEEMINNNIMLDRAIETMARRKRRQQCLSKLNGIIFDEDASQPVSVENRVMRVKIGSTAYIVDGFTVQIVCNATGVLQLGEYPATISWFYNGEPDQTKRNVTMITVTNGNHNDIFTCVAENVFVSTRKETKIIFVNEQFCI